MLPIVSRHSILTKFVLLAGAIFISLTVLASLVASTLIQNAYVGHIRETVASLVYGQAEILTPEDFSAADPVHTKEIFDRVRASMSSLPIARLKVWNTQSKVVYSDEPGIVGQVFPDNEELQEVFRDNVVLSEVAVPGNGETVSEAGFGPLLEVYVPLNFEGLNGPSGVIEVYFRMEDTNAQIRQTQIILVVTVTSFALVTFLLLFYFFRRYVFVPLNKLKETAGALEAGDLSRRVEIVTDGEVAVVAQAFNSMAEKLKTYTTGLEDKVRERTEFIRQVIDTDPSLIFVKDGELKFTLVNQALARAFGVSPEALIGKDGRELDLDPDTLERLMEDDRSALESGLLKFTPELAILHPVTGEKHWYQMIRAPLSGPQRSLLGVATDITPRKKAELQQKELDALKNKFIKIASHQLRTPLSSISWNLELILGGDVGPVSQGQEELLRLAYKANKEIISRIDDFLTAMNIEEGKAYLEKEDSQLGSLVVSVTESLRRQFEIKKISLDLNIQDGLPPINMDVEKVRGVIEKLLDNALSYTKEQGKVAVGVKLADGFVRVEVTDTGVGIPQSEQGNLFLRFQRASNSFVMKPDSSGLGLFIAKHFVEAHGGKIGFTSVEGRGSTFWFELPAPTTP